MELVDRELKRLTAKLRKHKRNTEKNGRKSVDKSRFNPSSDGELMHKYVLRYRSSLNSLDRTYEKMRKRDLADRNEREDGERRAEDRADRRVAEGGEGNWESDTAWARGVSGGRAGVWGVAAEEGRAAGRRSERLRERLRVGCRWTGGWRRSGRAKEWWGLAIWVLILLGRRGGMRDGSRGGVVFGGGRHRDCACCSGGVRRSG